ncbi:MAG: ABC transporter ATP-binding protein [Rhodocyclaceae bacterium]
MPSDIVISARGLTKTYRLFGHPGDRIKQFFSLGLRQYHREFTALKDISFDIRKGETVGIIGSNGSGKSTLLQLVCCILKPTAGTIAVNGRVSALLELGAGFNPEFTGRENVYFQGALMGLSREQMDARFDGIAAFADIGSFIDQPVRIYSSGMFLRLAFAVAVNVDSDILVVDEALAVGDAGFRSRCFRRIGELRGAGCTILFVSHDMEQVVRLCSRIMLLDEGEQLASSESDTESIVAHFLRLQNAGAERRHALRKQITLHSAARPDEENRQAGEPVPDLPPDAETAVAYDSNGALIENVRLLDDAGKDARLLRKGQTYRCLFRVRFTQDAALVRCALLIKTQDGLRLGGALTAPAAQAGIPRIAEGTLAEVEFGFSCLLNPGTYLLSVSAFASEGGVEYALHGIQSALRFQVEKDADRADTAIGAIDFNCRSDVRLAGSGAG